MNQFGKYEILKSDERKLYAKITLLYKEYCKGNESVFNQLERLRADYEKVYSKMIAAKEEDYKEKQGSSQGEKMQA